MTQLTIFDYKRKVDIRGLCDDAHCPKCGRGFLYPEETDLGVCPECGCLVDWERWHMVNDEEVLSEK